MFREEDECFHAFVVDLNEMRVLETQFLSFNTLKERDAALKGAGAIEGCTNEEFLLIPVISGPYKPYPSSYLISDNRSVLYDTEEIKDETDS